MAVARRDGGVFDVRSLPAFKKAASSTCVLVCVRDLGFAVSFLAGVDGADVLVLATRSASKRCRMD